ncbi:hypothetical protein AB0J14_13920 [Micromonospora arborensis]|uniref:hypothetical protein n=1 Tax=Micromonospora arborensis TaxID=2116518 RepID=UPI00340E0050
MSTNAVGRASGKSEVAQVGAFGEELYAVVVVSVHGAAGAGEADGDGLPRVLGGEPQQIRLGVDDEIARPRPRRRDRCRRVGRGSNGSRC